MTLEKTLFRYVFATAKKMEPEECKILGSETELEIFIGKNDRRTFPLQPSLMGRFVTRPLGVPTPYWVPPDWPHIERVDGRWWVCPEKMGPLSVDENAKKGVSFFDRTSDIFGKKKKDSKIILDTDYEQWTRVKTDVHREGWRCFETNNAGKKFAKFDEYFKIVREPFPQPGEAVHYSIQPAKRMELYVFFRKLQELSILLTSYNP
jgi:hypothetical protein